jgi:hypothetical protein
MTIRGRARCLAAACLLAAALAGRPSHGAPDGSGPPRSESVPSEAAASGAVRSDLAASAPALSAPADAEDGAYAELLTRRAEEALEARLRFLQKTQNADGTWGGEGSYKIASTAFALIAFMAKGYFPDEGPYGEVLSKGVGALLREGRPSDGYMGRVMYEHGLATLALSELWGHTDRDEQVRSALKLAVKVILGSQGEVGAWRYQPTPRGGGDVSVTAMMTVALASAREAGILVPDKVMDRAIHYVEMCSNEVDGGFSYTGVGPSAPERSAAAVVSLMMCGRHDTEVVQRGLRYVLSRPFRLGGRHGHYGCYYGAIAGYKSSPQDFARWYVPVRDLICASPITDHGGQRTWEVGVEAIVLAMPYGFVPAYQR